MVDLVGAVLPLVVGLDDEGVDVEGGQGGQGVRHRDREDVASPIPRHLLLTQSQTHLVKGLLETWTNKT